MRRAQSIWRWVAAALLLVWSCGILLPAPWRGLLLLSVGAPELSPWLLVLAVALGAGAVHTLRAESARPSAPSLSARALMVVSAVSIAAALSVVVRVPGTTRQVDARLAEAFGTGYLSRRPAEARARLRPSPVVLRDLFLGLRAGPVKETRGVRFATSSGVPLTVDIYQPPSGTGAALVQVYGGAWQRGAPGDDPVLARQLAAAGHVVFAVDYRHAPAWRWPAQLEDLDLALDWVHLHAGQYGADAEHLAILGRSAGGHLALMAAYALPRQHVRAVISLYGPTDLVEGYRDLPRPDPIGVRRTLEALMGGGPDAMLPRYSDASPLTHAGTRQPPTLQIAGARDHIVLPRFPRLLDARLRASGNTSVLVEIPWADHAFDAVTFGPSAQLALYTIERFLMATTADD